MCGEMPIRLPSHQKRVQSGVEWLDQYKPGWERLVNLSKLEGPAQLFLQVLDHQERKQIINQAVSLWFIRNGFAIALNSDIEPLVEAWTQQIKLRFETGAFSDL